MKIKLEYNYRLSSMAQYVMDIIINGQVIGQRYIISNPEEGEEEDDCDFVILVGYEHIRPTWASCVDAYGWVI